MTLSLVLRFLHVLSAALWLGAALFWPGAVRRALAAAPAAPPAPALAQARAGVGLDLGAGLATVASGLLYLALGGFDVRRGLEAGLALALLRLVLLFVLARPALAAAAAGVAGGDLEGARGASRRLPAYAGAAHLLWLLALACMIWPV